MRTVQVTDRNTRYTVRIGGVGRKETPLSVERTVSEAGGAVSSSLIWSVGQPRSGEVYWALNKAFKP